MVVSITITQNTQLLIWSSTTNYRITDPDPVSKPVRRRKKTRRRRRRGKISGW